MNCSRDSDETGNYNGSTDILEIEFIFNDNKHAGFYLRITTDCNSSSIALIPCRFSTYVDFYNNSTILVICQNPTFINSSSPMIIQEYRGNQYVRSVLITHAKIYQTAYNVFCHMILINYYNVNYMAPYSI